MGSLHMKNERGCSVDVEPDEEVDVWTDEYSRIRCWIEGNRIRNGKIDVHMYSRRGAAEKMMYAMGRATHPTVCPLINTAAQCPAR